MASTACIKAFAQKLSEDGIDKPLHEMGAMKELDSALRSGDMWVPGSRYYADFEDYLLPHERWKDIRNNDGPPVAIDNV